MKFIKLNSRYVLGREGFTHGLEFTSKDLVKQTKVEVKLREMLGGGWSRYSWQHSSCHGWGSYHNRKNFRTYIGVRDEAILTALMLSTE